MHYGVFFFFVKYVTYPKGCLALRRTFYYKPFEVGSTQVITSEMDEAAFLRSQIVEIRRRKDGLYAERAEHANTEVQIRLLLELVDEMVKNSLPEWMEREEEPEVEETGACRDRGGRDLSGNTGQHITVEMLMWLPFF